MNTLTLNPLNGNVYSMSTVRMQHLVSIISALRGVTNDVAWYEACAVVTYMERSAQLKEYAASRLRKAKQMKYLECRLQRIHDKLDKRLDAIFAKCRNGEYKTKARPVK